MASNAIKSDFRSSKMAAGSHYVKQKVAYWSEMAINAFESDFWSSKMAAGSYFVKKNKRCVLIWNGEKYDQKWFSVIQNGRRQPICEKNKKLCIDLKWREMPLKEMVIQNGRRQLFCEKIKVAYWSEMARNTIKSDFRSSKMAAGSPFVKKNKKKKVAYWSEIARNAIESDFRSSKMAAGSHFVKK